MRSSISTLLRISHLELKYNYHSENESMLPITSSSICVTDLHQNLVDSMSHGYILIESTSSSFCSTILSNQILNRTVGHIIRDHAHHESYSIVFSSKNLFRHVPISTKDHFYHAHIDTQSYQAVFSSAFPGNYNNLLCIII